MIKIIKNTKWIERPSDIRAYTLYSRAEINTLFNLANFNLANSNIESEKDNYAVITEDDLFLIIRFKDELLNFRKQDQEFILQDRFYNKDYVYSVLRNQLP